MQSNEPLILIISAHVLSENVLACFWEIVLSERIGFLTSNKARKIFVYIYRILIGVSRKLRPRKLRPYTCTAPQMIPDRK